MTAKAGGVPGGRPATAAAARSSDRMLCLLTVAIVLGAYAFAIGEPRVQVIRNLHREIGQLDAERSAGRSAARRARRVPPAGDVPPRVFGKLKARELVPRISALARRAGLKVQVVKQSADAAAPEVRRIHIRANGGFAELVQFLEEITEILHDGRIDELTLRRPSESAEIELDSVLHVRVDVNPGRAADRGGSG